LARYVREFAQAAISHGSRVTGAQEPTIDPRLLAQIVKDMTRDLELEIMRRMEAEQRWRAFSSAATEAFMLLDGELKIVDTNTRSEQLFGVTRDQILGRPLSDVGVLKPLAQVLAVQAPCIISGQEQSFELDLTDRDQTVVHLAVTAFPVGEQIGTLARNITAERRLQQSLKVFGERQRVLLREVNHRVRNNLATLVGLLRKEFGPAAASEPGSIILANIERRLRVLASLHDLLSESGWGSIPLAELAERVVKSILDSRPARCQVQLRVEPTSARVSGDLAHHLALVLSELAINTTKHGLGHRPRAAVGVQISQVGRRLTLQYQDDGPGYPVELTLGDHARDHTGLDLIHGIVTHTLGGRLTLGNDPGATATIEFELGQSNA
jgi:PAS domain S-box-containing protein